MNWTTIAVAAAGLALAASPAAAKSKMMSCTGANMNKMYTSMGGMADGPAKWRMIKPISMMNASMSKGDMRGACKHMMSAQRG